MTDAATPMEDVVATGGEGGAEEPKTFSLDILGTIKGNQTKHGLRHGDYLRYRQFCTRRIHRLRKSLKILNGKGRFTKKVIKADNMTSERFLHIPLVSAERCWSFGMQLRADNEANEPRPRHHALRKLERARVYSLELQALCEAAGDKRTKFEANAYAQYMNGTVALERGDFKTALQNFTHVRTVYEQLAKVGAPDQQDLCLTFVKDLEPHITLCEYQLSKSSGGTVDAAALRELALRQGGVGGESLKATLETVLAEERGKSATELQSVRYRDQTVAVKSDKVRVLLVSVNEYRIEMEKTTDETERFDWYDKILMTLQDARRHVQADLKATGTSQKGQVQKETLTLLEEYLAWQALEQTVSRNLDLVKSYEARLEKQREAEKTATEYKGERARPDDIARLFGSLMQNMTDMLDIANANDDEDTAAALGIKQMYFRAARCVAMAQSYAGALKFPAATALYERAAELCESALSQASQDLDIQDKLAKVQHRAQSEKSGLLATAFLQSKRATDEVTDRTSSLGLLHTSEETQFLRQRLGKYIGCGGTNGDPQLVDFPPAFQAIPCKPLLFDLGYDEIHYPEVEGGEEKKKKGGGWFGGWLGGK
eukprot:TRINITY_DN2958_c0_g3_i1.p1 TRINITY_DN2958_c0_g3~~TRINITY_DN2958_c0_g3_i1.p1  ORF type:complete len:600 (-),score=164.28 TRINITY_DN2958_c0_g3_i1:767-2566(-)